MILSKKDITQSIENAKRIQDTILPKESKLKQIFAQSFIIYIPKNTLSGDFYWIEEINNTVLFSVADCTGHGVPGAVLTVICHNAMNKALKEYGTVIPGHILDKTLEIITDDFKKNGQSIDDGMDIAICSKTEYNLQFSGANNPLWIIRNKGLIEVKPTKQAICVNDNPSLFITNDIRLEKNDALYMFSDGILHQLGGEKDKKFSSGRLKDLLISVNHLTMVEQKIILEKSFRDWKGKKEQTDDICVMGVRV